MVATPNTVWYANSVGWTAITAWATGTAKTVGALVRQNAAPTVGNERAFICIVAGNTHASTEPTWVVTKGAKTTDNTVTWQECTGQPGVNGDITNTPLSSGQRSSTVPLGLIIQNNGGTALFICSTSGVSGAGEPTYDTTVGHTTADGVGTLVWTCIGSAALGGSFGAPFARLASAGSFTAVGDIVYVKSNHAETQGSAISIDAGSNQDAAAPVKFLCVSGSHTPPTSADITTGATVTTTGAFGMTINRHAYFQGIEFDMGTGAVGPTLLIGSLNVGSTMRFDNCVFNCNGTSFCLIKINTGIGGRVIMNNCNIGFQVETLLTAGGHWVWREGSLVKLGASFTTTVVIGTLSSANVLSGDILIENVDLSAFDHANGSLFGANVGNAAKAVLSHCKLPSTSTVTTGQGANGGGDGYMDVDVINCDSAGALYRTERYRGAGNHVTDAVTYKTSGASDGTTNFSWRMRLSYQVAGICDWGGAVFECIPLDIWNTVTGTNRVVTIEGMWDQTALPNNDDIWLETVYFGTASSTLGSRATQTKASYIAANAALPSSSALWTAPARQNSHAYVLGDTILVASSGGVNRVFVCTTAGTSLGSLPGAYATATDGTVVTDSGAHFTAGTRFQLMVTMSSPQPQSAGVIRSYIRAGNQGGANPFIWIDPKPTLS